MKPLLVIVALLTWAGGVKADRIYLLFDEDCMNRIRYERMIDGQPRMDYYSYGLTASNGTTLIFETDAEGATYQALPPADYLQCSSNTLTAELADRINQGQTHLFVVLRAGEEQYQVQPVVMAATLESRDDDLRYRSPFAAFSFNREDAVIGVDIDNGNEGARVYFEGKEGDDCSGAFLFRQQNPHSAYPVIRYKLVPRLGIVERHMSSDGKFGKESEISAREVNGVSLEQYLTDLCAPSATESSYSFAQRNFRPLYVEPETPRITAAAQAKDVPYVEVPEATMPPAQPTSAPVTVHQVVRGETLYAISRRYGVGVDAIRQRNGLRDNTIYVGQQLTIDAADAPSEPVYNSYEYAEEQAAPVPYERPYTETASVTSGKFHIVQPGETLASLALRFGYTTARFREFNQLGDQTVAQVGQRLRTSDCNCPPAAPTTPAPVVEEEIPQPSSYVTPAPARPADDYAAPPQPYTESYAQPVPVAQPNVHVVVPPAHPVSEPSPAYTPPAYGAGINIGSDTPPTTYGSSPSQPDMRITHQVREGDSLYSISRQYSVSVEELRRLNGLDPADVIVPFQKLYVN
ncbi:LysM peptidoglycan-binding domain-containing protein [Lewinella sp. JB7]|uniref:LysM peptidoglycan-binding domain-containing protein n=1 Tax=Lewinella sp. JB7 TaxID=2962887 RepID=UPI0020C9CA1E|nr:LysM peptidoglycan-binding domain-containing protein [Lewinella sp. JB7]MCP9237770.1 LysM peptidoglycan-binding domain-containing protein [Lewinella sp. JB7]